MTEVPAGSTGMTPVGDEGFMDPCSPVALTPEGSVNSGSTGPLALTPSPLPARLPSLERSVEPQQARWAIYAWNQAVMHFLNLLFCFLRCICP